MAKDCYTIEKSGLESLYSRALLIAKDAEYFLNLIRTLFTSGREQKEGSRGYSGTVQRKRAYKVFRGILKDVQSLRSSNILKRSNPMNETIFYHILTTEQALHEMVLLIGIVMHETYYKKNPKRLKSIKIKIDRVIMECKDAMEYLR